MIKKYILLIIISIIIISKTNGFAEWLANQYCDRPLIVGEIIMNQEVELSNDRKILVYRDGIELKSGSEYKLGEILTISVTELQKKNQFMFETKNAKFESGGCDGIRSAKEKPNLILPDKMLVDNDNIVTIVSGWAYGHETVYVTEPFILIPPTSISSLSIDKKDNNNNNNNKDENNIPKKVKSHPKIVPKTPSQPVKFIKKSVNSTRKNLMNAQHEEDIAIRLDTLKKSRADVKEGIGNKDINEPKISKEKLEEIISKNKKDITEHWKKIKTDIISSTGIKNSEIKKATKKAKKEREKKIKEIKKKKKNNLRGSQDHTVIVSFVEYILVVIAIAYISYKIVKERFKIFRYYLRYRGRNVDQ